MRDHLIRWGRNRNQVEAEVSSLRVWMENRYLGTGVGFVHGYREAKLSLHVLSVVLETTLDAKFKKATEQSLSV